MKCVQRLAFVFGFCAWPALLAGCVSNDDSFTIDKFVLMDPTSFCVANPAATVGKTHGLLDVSLVAQGFRGYIAGPTVGNHLVERVSTTGIELDSIELQGFDIQLHPDATLAAIAPAPPIYFVASAGGRILPAGLVAVPIEIVPAAYAAKLTSVNVSGGVMPIVTAALRPVGQHSGSQITGPFTSFPVAICNGCLSGPIAACPTGGFPTNAVQMAGCFPQQDFTVTCCTQNSQLLCGSQVPHM